MKNIASIFILFALYSHPLSADFLSGASLLKSCKAYIEKTSEAVGNTCAGYIAGVNDIQETMSRQNILLYPLWCIPDKVKFTQLVWVTYNYLGDRKDSLELAAGSLAMNALISAFPCE